MSLNTSLIEQLFHELSLYQQVEAIALGGSRAGDSYDETSDYDVYVYCTEQISEESRKNLLAEFCSVMEIGNHFWEYEDNCTLKNNIDLDILYRNLDAFLAGISDVVFKHQAQNGYTTCMWHNLKTCKIIYDRDGRLADAKNKYSVPYPFELKNNIIARNMKLLRHSLPAYEHQIQKALNRTDLVSVNHRTTEFMASYFDVIFALNEMTHPGEKRLVELCLKNCGVLPQHFEQNITLLFQDLFVAPDRVEEDLNQLITELENVLSAAGTRPDIAHKES